MAKAPKKEVEENSKESVVDTKNQMKNLLKANKDDHYNFEESILCKTKSSSMTLNTVMAPSFLGTGTHRFCGGAANGKTSCACDFLLNFLSEASENELRKGVYFKAEGRLSEELRRRSGVKFVTDVDEWENGTCLIIDSNVFEFIFDMVRQLIVDNESKTKYFFIIDSVDMMVKRADLAKSLEDAQQVAGGALITSVFLKKVSVALNKRGHTAIFISQLRDTVKINPYDKTPPKQGNASGGHALEHGADWVIEFLPRFGDDIIRENANEKNSKPIGHYCKFRVVKANNNSYLREGKYPILYSKSNGSAVWVEKEVVDMLLAWELLSRSGAWYKLQDQLLQELKDNNLKVEEKFQGMESVNKWLETNPDIVKYLVEKFSKLITGI